MPVYEYEHLGDGCKLGRQFEITRRMNDEKLAQCPQCGGEVKRLISLFAVSTPKTNTELKDMGFTKLVRRDNGVYENVTATGTESKILDSNKPETMPHLHKKITD